MTSKITVNFGLKKVRRTGKNELVISLPSVWVRSLQVAKGSVLEACMHREGELTLKLVSNPTVLAKEPDMNK